MRLQEFADAEEQIKLWKLMANFVCELIRLKSIWQEKSLIMVKTRKKDLNRQPV